MNFEPRSSCPINQAVEVLGDPWVMLVFRDIMVGNRRHARDLPAGTEEDIAPQPATAGCGGSATQPWRWVPPVAPS